MDRCRIGNGLIEATVAAHGAELTSLRAPEAGELLWQAGEPWKRHAPVLFPVVGRLPGDEFREGAHRARLGQHGFARDRAFRLVTSDAASCTFALEADAETRAIYPYGFSLAITYRVRERTLDTLYRVTNTGDATMPMSLGTHPAFRWPLADGLPKTAHRIVFEADEPGPAGRLRDGFLLPDPAPSPVHDRVLPLADALFAHDAIILRGVRSRRVRYEAEGAPVAIAVAWQGFSDLGIWSKPGPFVCIEPWSGVSSPVGFRGDFSERPGVLHVAPGDVVERRLLVTIETP